jgi:hypothetical protein
MSALLLLLVAAVSGPQLRLEPAEVELGQPFVLHVELPAGEGRRYELPLHPRLPGVTLLGVERGEDSLALRLQVTGALGEVDLPELPLHVIEEGRVKTLSLPMPVLRIVPTVAEGDEELAQPAPPRVVREPSWRVAYLAGGVLLAAALLWWARRWWRMRRGDPEPEVVPPEVRALLALDALEGEALVAAGRGREHYFRLSEIVRRFIGEAAGVPALDLTTEELCTALSRREIPGLDVSALEAWLRRGDRVRFARAPADPAEAAADLQEARRFVDGSAPGREAA